MALEEIENSLNAGGVALLPTDTVYGLLARPDRPEAVEKIFTLKNRPATKNLPVLVANTTQLAALGVRLTPEISRLLQSRFIPGALTLVLSVAPKDAPRWLQHRSEVAVRLPDDSFLRALMEKTGPLLATSANASGVETASNINEIGKQLNGKPDVIRDGGPRTGAASTLLDCTSHPFKVLRRGALSNPDLAEMLAL